MFWNATHTSVASAWQTEIEFAQEAGDTPLLEWGEASPPLSWLIAAPPAQRFIRERTDAAAPLLLAGGPGVAWLDFLFTEPTQPGMVDIATLYTGCERACRIGSTAAAASAASSLRSMPAAVPLGMADLLVPESRPGLLGGWDRLPLWSIEEGEGWSPLHALAPHADLQAWLAGVFVFFLLTVALIAGALINAAPAA